MDQHYDNSSDAPFPPSSPDPYANIGKRAVASIIQGAVADRIASKDVLRRLKDNAGGPSEQKARMYWLKLFEAHWQELQRLQGRST